MWFDLSSNVIHSLTQLVADDGSSSTTDAYINDIRLHCPIYIPTDAQRAEIEERLLQEGFSREWYFEHVYTRQSNVVSAANPTESFAVSGGVPIRVYCVPVPKASENSSTADRTVFLPGTATSYISRINLTVDGQRVVEKDLENSGRTDCADFYRAYLDHLRRQDNTLGATLSYDDFRLYYNIICFDLQHQDKTLFDTSRAHDIAYEIQSTHGGTAATADYRLYTVVVLKAKMKIVGSNGQIYITK